MCLAKNFRSAKDIVHSFTKIVHNCRVSWRLYLSSTNFTSFSLLKLNFFKNLNQFAKLWRFKLILQFDDFFFRFFLSDYLLDLKWKILLKFSHLKKIWKKNRFFKWLLARFKMKNIIKIFTLEKTDENKNILKNSFTEKKNRENTTDVMWFDELFFRKYFSKLWQRFSWRMLQLDDFTNFIFFSARCKQETWKGKILTRNKLLKPKRLNWKMFSRLRLYYKIHAAMTWY